MYILAPLKEWERIWVECVFACVLECHFIIILQHYPFVIEKAQEFYQVLNSQNTQLEKLDQPRSTRWTWGNQIHKPASHLCLEFN